MTPEDLEKIHDLKRKPLETFVFTDASQHGASIVAFQKQGDEEKLIMQESCCFKSKHGIGDAMGRE